MPVEGCDPNAKRARHGFRCHMETTERKIGVTLRTRTGLTPSKTGVILQPIIGGPSIRLPAV